MPTEMPTDKPKDISEYNKWLADNHDVKIDRRVEEWYRSVASRMKDQLEGSEFWVEFARQLREFDYEYEIRTGYGLRARTRDEVKLIIKPVDSFLLKTFRKNVLDNKQWPDAPQDGWILPHNWYARVSDVIRTRVLVRYLDGVKHLTDRLEALAKKHSLQARTDLEARMEGYYAAHFDVASEVEIPRLTWDTERIEVWLEVQVTTQVQELILKFLHKYYEERRRYPAKADKKWQWDYGSKEFSVNYLGHMLHYIEGMIMEIRDNQRGGTR